MYLALEKYLKVNYLNFVFDRGGNGDQRLALGHTDTQGLRGYLLLKGFPCFAHACKIYFMCHILLERRPKCTIEFLVMFIYQFPYFFFTLITFIFPLYSWHLWTKHSNLFFIPTVSLTYFLQRCCFTCANLILSIS